MRAACHRGLGRHLGGLAEGRRVVRLGPKESLVL
jgi:hypothetical protein